MQQSLASKEDKQSAAERVQVIFLYGFSGGDRMGYSVAFVDLLVPMVVVRSGLV